MKDHEKAKAWREKRGLTFAQLAELSGYSELSIRWFEKGETPPDRNAKSGNGKDRKVKPWVWQRYRLVCSGVDRQLATRKTFEW